MNNYNIVLIGPVGTQKLEIGTELSQKLSMRLVDTDSEIEIREGMDTNSIYAKYGEWYFRNIEQNVIQAKCMLDNVVIVIGEGAAFSITNIEALRQKCIIVYIKAKVDAIIRNISRNTDKKCLINEYQLRNRIKMLLECRKHCYSNNDYEIDVSDLTPEEACNEIITRIGINSHPR